MGIHVIKMPDIGEGIAEVELVGWHVREGDTVTEDQVLADVMTDKANVEIPSPVAGRVLKLGGEVGKTMAVGSELIRLEVEGAGNVREGHGAAGAAAPRSTQTSADASTLASSGGTSPASSGATSPASFVPAAHRSST
jgi:2-oxoisovalerate dehydrogenase E2 component (dihydrolipoyl transacylase)